MSVNLPGQNALEYGAGVNADFLGFMGPLNGVVLDIGCGTGRWAGELRAAGATTLKGVEPTSYAAQAAARYDQVVERSLEEIDPEFLADVDHLVCADVLEHVVDPWAALRSFREAVPSGAQLWISLPNAQNYRIALPLLTRGSFDYSDAGGIMDRGHLRWFTGATLRSAVEEAGWTVQRQGGVVLGRVARSAMRLSAGRAGPAVYHQLHLHARAQ